MNTEITSDTGYVTVGIFDKRSENELTEDFILPDYLPDIGKIVRVSASPSNVGTYISKDGIEYDGEIRYDLLFISEDGRLRGAVFSDSFEGAVQVSGLSDSCTVRADADAYDVTFRAVNPRKVNIRSKAVMSIGVYDKKSTEPQVIGKESIEDEINLEKLKKEITDMRIFCAEEKNIKMSGDLEAAASMPEISELVSTKARISVDDCRTADGSVHITGNAEIICIYMSHTEDGGEKYTTLRKKLPVSEDVDVPGAAEGCRCIVRTSVGELRAEVSENSYGEKKTVEMDFAFDLSVCAVCTDKTVGVSDVYSTEYECENGYTALGLNELVYDGKSNFSVNLSKKREEVDGWDAVGVIDVDVMLAEEHLDYDAERGKLVFGATAHVVMLTENAEGVASVVFSAPVKTEIPARGVIGGFGYNISAAAADAGGRLDGTNVYADFEVLLELTVFNRKSERIVETVRLDKSKPINDGTGAPKLLLYYPADGESLWDIAKKYRVTEHSIKNSNADRGVILIPCNPKKASYKGVVS